ncbi:SPOR domain-containing protein [Eionea flava]
MRFIFFTLIFVNIGFAIYQYWLPVEQGAVTGVVLSVNSSRSIDDRASLTLLSEMRPVAALETVRVATPEDVVLPSGSGEVDAGSNEGVVKSLEESLCLKVGAFSSVSKANYFVERLASKGVKSSIKNVLVSTTVGFWLHLPPLSSKKALFRKLEELQRQGIDSYAIPDGNLANGISLGMFSQAQRANSLKQKISGLGYRPQIAEVPREKRELWVFLHSVEAQKISDEVWKKWLSSKEFPKKQQISCSDVASA